MEQIKRIIYHSYLDSYTEDLSKADITKQLHFDAEKFEQDIIMYVESEINFKISNKITCSIFVHIDEVINKDLKVIVFFRIYMVISFNDKTLTQSVRKTYFEEPKAVIE